MLNRDFLNDLMNMRRKAEVDPEGYLKLKNKYTHDISCSIRGIAMKRMDEIFRSYIAKYGRFSYRVMSLLKVGVGIEYDSKEVTRIYKESKEMPPAYDLSLRAICHDEEIIYLMNNIINKRKIPENFENTKRFIKICKERRNRYMSNHATYRKCGILTNGTSTRIKRKYNMTDITGVVFHNSKYRPPTILMSRLNIFRHIMWSYIDWTDQTKNAYGYHFCVPGKECKVLREVYSMDPELQLDSKAITHYFRYIAKGFDANATWDQYKWINKCLKFNWNRDYFIVSTDMDKYSDSLNRKIVLKILVLCGIIDECEVDELDYIWGLDVWDRDKNKLLENSDSVKQGQYSIYDVMTIINLFLQSLIYDILGEDSEFYNEESERIESKNSALGDDTVLAFINEQPKALDVIKAVFGYLGVKISNAKTHIMCRGKDYRNGVISDKDGFIDFAKRIVTKSGLVPYISANAISKNNFDDHIKEVIRLIPEHKGLAEAYCLYYLTESDWNWINKLHKINGGLRTDAITDSDMILFEYKINRLFNIDRVTISELNNHLDWIESQTDQFGDKIRLSNTALVGWLDEVYEDGHHLLEEYIPNEIDDNIIRARILNYTFYGKDIDMRPLDYIGKTWDEVKDMDLFSECMMTIKVKEKNIKSKIRSTVYKEMRDLNLGVYKHNIFIYQFSVQYDPSGKLNYEGMKLEALCKKVNKTFRDRLKIYASSHSGVSLCYDVCYNVEREFLSYKGRSYKMYKTKRNSIHPDVPYEVFEEITRDCFYNREKDMKDFYNIFLQSLDYLDYSNQ